MLEKKNLPVKIDPKRNTNCDSDITLLESAPLIVRCTVDYYCNWLNIRTAIHPVISSQL